MFVNLEMCLLTLKIQKNVRILWRSAPAPRREQDTFVAAIMSRKGNFGVCKEEGGHQTMHIQQ